MSSSALSEPPAIAGNARGHDDAVVVAFTAPWCGHCKAMLPDLRNAARRPAGPRLEIVDVSTAPDVASTHSVSGTPTLVAYRNGREVARMVGRRGPAEISAFFEALVLGTPHRRSLAEPGLRIAGGVVVGILGLMFDAPPLMGFAVLVILLTAASEWRARRG